MQPEVLIVDDEEGVRQSLASVLSTYDLETASACTAREGIEIVRVRNVGCVLLDVRMPELDGLAALRLIHAIKPGLPVIIITGHADVPMAVQAMKDGAHDFVEKPISDEVLVASIESALTRHRREAAQEPVLTGIMERYATLTPREQAVASLVVDGYSSAAIAATLEISVRTVDHHRASILAKMQATSLPQLLRFLLAVPRNPD